jgi:hypothetical protein
LAIDLLTTEEDIKNQESCRISPEMPDEKETLDLKNLDRLDKRSLLTVILLVAGIFLVLILPASDGLAPVNKKRRSGPQIVTVSAESLNKIAIARKLVINNNLAQAEGVLEELRKDMPYEGEPYMLMGDLLTRKNMPIKAMYEYRKGVDLNPDFLDKKADVFQGKKIKVLVNEARIAIDEGRSSGSIDGKSVRKHKDTLYYMLRKIAGSCG